MAKRKQSTALAKIQRDAKRIRNSTGKSYQAALKEAGRNYKAGKSTRPRKKATKSKTKKAATMPKKRARKALNATHYMKKAKVELEDKMGDLYVKQFKAKGVQKKRQIGKDLKKVKSQIRRLP
jgi:hypothetical protein